MSAFDNITASIPSLPSNLFQSLQLPDTRIPISYYLGTSFAGYLIWKIGSFYYDVGKLKGIKTVGGYEGLLSSYVGVVKMFKEGRGMVDEGYRKFANTFKIPQPNGWMVVVLGDKKLNELRNAPDDVLSFQDAVADILAIDYTMGPEIHTDPYHVSTVRNQLTRNIANCFEELHEEIKDQFNLEIPKSKEWVKLPALKTVMKVVSGTSNRLFVGLPLCRNDDYRSLNVEYTIDVVKSASVINLFPEFMKPLVAKMCTGLQRTTQRGLKHLGPLIQERMDMIEKNGLNWEGKPNDFLQWLLSDAYGHPSRYTIHQITLRILVVNFAAIHTSSMAFTSALYYLASHPEYIPELRIEIESVIQEEGSIDKSSLGKMRKLDSFLRESQRLSGVGAVAMSRKVMKDFVFEDGTFLPKGQTVAVPGWSLHHDETIYENPSTFDPFRFSRARNSEEDENKGVTKYQVVNTSSEYVTFGHGKHACPGRFFAATELKAMLCHLLLNYDVKLPDGEEGKEPELKWMMLSSFPDPEKEVCFRERQT